MLRGDGSAVRALILALFLQVLAPVTGMFGAADARAATFDSITVCTTHGVVTMVPDGQGGWTEASNSHRTGISCAFCLPLLSGQAGPVSNLETPLPIGLADPAPVPLALAAAEAHPPGSSTPRAPPLLR
ncbi:MAG: DUF2946 family protein [Solirubrobacterales bacterium]